MESRLSTLAVFVSFAILGGCASETGPSGPAGAGPIDGRDVYERPFADGNTFACATCHALEEPAADGLRRPGHPIGDAAARPHYKNGALTSMLDAVNTCVEEWMNAEPMADDDPRWAALEAFLSARAPAEAPPVEIQRVDPPADVTGGAADAGRATFNGTCAVCHGRDATGTERAPALAGRELDGDYVAERVRQSGRVDSATYDGLTGGLMPFWGADRLSDAELRDVVAFVTEVSRGELPGGPVDDPDPVDPVEPGDPEGCGATHPSVGRTAELVTRFHDVAGTATIVDDCTIVIEGFHFDSRGIDVQIYAARGGDYDAGFSLSDNLIRGAAYEGETLTLTLPAGRTLDDLDGISVWCVPVGVSFGDGRFE